MQMPKERGKGKKNEEREQKLSGKKEEKEEKLRSRICQRLSAN